MKSRPKDLGTAFETWTVKKAEARGLVAERIAEGGSKDRGDVRIVTNQEWVGECKNRTNLNIHTAVQNAVRKSGHPNTFVIWKRLVRKNGNTNPHPAGTTDCRPPR